MITFTLLTILAFLFVSRDGAAITRSDVLQDAQSWVDNAVPYGLGPDADYCPGDYYCDPLRGGECYRSDCSGFVSATWGLPGPGLSTHMFAGGPWNTGDSHPITPEELLPGDALNKPGVAGTIYGHIMLYVSGDFYSGWVEVYEEYTCGAVATLHWRSIDPSEYIPIRLNDIEPFVKPLKQVSGNDAMALVNWPDDGTWPLDGHPEIFVTDPSGGLFHMYPTGHGDDWSAADRLGTGAACGFAAGFWPAPKNYAEVFSPRADGTTAHLWLASGEWTAFEDFGGSGLTHLTTVTWTDGRQEVFGLGPDGAVWHNYWVSDTEFWSGWQSLEGDFVTGPSAISWEDGHVELFATDEQGRAWHRWSGDFEGGWHDWEILGGELASRPVPVRWPDGHVEVFARGEDGRLQHSWYAETWTPFTVESADTTILGEPAVAMNPDGAGVPAGPEVVARGTDGRVLHLWWNGEDYSPFEPLGDQAAASDPTAWAREDGTMEVFVIDPSGDLRHIRRDASKTWQGWSSLGSGFNPCVASEPPSPDAGVDADEDAAVEDDAVEEAPAEAVAVEDGSDEAGEGQDSNDDAYGSCACSLLPARQQAPGCPALVLSLAALAALLRPRRRPRRRGNGLNFIRCNCRLVIRK